MTPSCHVDTKEYILTIQSALDGKIFKYTPDKILEVNLKEDEILNSESSSQTQIKTNTLSMIGRAVAGQLLLGPAAALAGAVTATRNAQSAEVGSTVSCVQSVYVEIFLDGKPGYFRIEFLEKKCLRSSQDYKQAYASAALFYSSVLSLTKKISDYHRSLSLKQESDYEFEHSLRVVKESIKNEALSEEDLAFVRQILTKTDDELLKLEMPRSTFEFILTNEDWKKEKKLKDKLKRERLYESLTGVGAAQLYEAIFEKHDFKLSEYLIKTLGADVNSRVGDFSFLEKALYMIPQPVAPGYEYNERGYEEVEHLLKMGAITSRIQGWPEDHFTPLELAVDFSRAKLFKLLIDNGVSPIEINEDGAPEILSYVADCLIYNTGVRDSLNREECKNRELQVKYLQEWQADNGMTDQYLQQEARRIELEKEIAAQALELEQQRNINIDSIIDYEMLDMVTRRDAYAAKREPELQALSNIELSDFAIKCKNAKQKALKSGKTYLSYFEGKMAAELYDCLFVKKLPREAAKLIRQHGADLNGSYDGYTFLEKAIYEQEEGVAKFLVLMGADLERRLKYGETAIELAAENSSATLFKMLLQRGARLFALGEAESSNIEDSCVSVLLDDDADIVDRLEKIDIFKEAIDGRNKIT